MPDHLQAEALHFVEYLDRRRDAAGEAAEWQQLLRETQSAPGARRVTEEDIAAEIAAIRKKA